MTTRLSSPKSTALYETDFYQWTLRQASLLREEDYADLDIDNLIEEIEDMGNNARHELDSRLTTIMEHMLKLMREPKSRAARGWQHTILIQRTDLKKRLKSTVSLRTQNGVLPTACSPAFGFTH